MADITVYHAFYVDGNEIVDRARFRTFEEAQGYQVSQFNVGIEDESELFRELPWTQRTDGVWEHVSETGVASFIVALPISAKGPALIQKIAPFVSGEIAPIA